MTLNPDHCYEFKRTSSTELTDTCGTGPPLKRVGTLIIYYVFYNELLEGRRSTPYCGPAGCNFDNNGFFHTESLFNLGAEFTIGFWLFRNTVDSQYGNVFDLLVA